MAVESSHPQLKIILNARASGQVQAGHSDFALLSLSNEALREITGRVEEFQGLAQKYPDLTSTSYRFSRALYIEATEQLYDQRDAQTEERFETVISRGHPFIVPSDKPLAFREAGAEEPEIVVTREGIYFRAVTGEGAISGRLLIMTDRISLEILNELAGAGGLL